MWISSHWCQWYNCFSRFSKHLRWKYYLLMAYSTSYRTIYWSGIFKLFFRLQVRYLFSSQIYYCLHLLICLYFSRDFLTIYDGSSNSSLTFGQYCGNSIPQSRISSTNEMYIYFQSDGKDHNINDIAGFQISYRTYSKLCKQVKSLSNTNAGILKVQPYVAIVLRSPLICSKQLLYRDGLWGPMICTS